MQAKRRESSSRHSRMFARALGRRGILARPPPVPFAFRIPCSAFMRNRNGGFGGYSSAAGAGGGLSGGAAEVADDAVEVVVRVKPNHDSAGLRAGELNIDLRAQVLLKLIDQ